MKNLFRLTLIVAFATVLLSCNKNLVFEQYQRIPEKIWYKDSVLVFNIAIEDSTRNNNFIISVRNDIGYKYSNLWLFLSIEQPNGETMNDKFEIALADPSGKWLGNGLGGLKTREAMYRRNIFFPVPGEYKVFLQQGMREDYLQGISDVGIRIEAVK